MKRKTQPEKRKSMATKMFFINNKLYSFSVDDVVWTPIGPTGSRITASFATSITNLDLTWPSISRAKGLLKAE